MPVSKKYIIVFLGTWQLKACTARKPHASVVSLFTEGMMKPLEIHYLRGCFGMGSMSYTLGLAKVFEREYNYRK